MPNIEIKARCGDLGKARDLARKKATAHLGLLHQVDTYFTTRKGRLKLREITQNDEKHSVLIPYYKCFQPGAHRSDYALIPVQDPARIKLLLGTLLGTEFVVEKRREIFLIENVRVHLDEVADLGTFIELEAVFQDRPLAERLEREQYKKIEKLMEEFQIRQSELLDRSYIDYMMQSEGK